VFVAKGNDKRETGSAREREGEREGGEGGAATSEEGRSSRCYPCEKEKERERESLGDEGPL